MLQATLEEGTGSWVDPALQASYDANNTTSGPLYEERLRLRNAERLLLVEIEYNAAYIPDNEEREGNMSPNLNGEPESLWPNSSNNNNIVDSSTFMTHHSEECENLSLLLTSQNPTRIDVKTLKRSKVMSDI